MQCKRLICKRSNGLIYGVFHIRYSINKDIELLSFVEIGEEYDDWLLKHLAVIDDVDKTKEAIYNLVINEKSYSDIILDSIMVVIV